MPLVYLLAVEGEFLGELAVGDSLGADPAVDGGFGGLFGEVFAEFVDAHPFLLRGLGVEAVEFVVDEGGDAVEPVEDGGDCLGHFFKGDRGARGCVGACHLM